MDAKTCEQLEKVLALADSNHEAEALAALRKARQLLARDEMSFADLAKAATRARFNLPFFSGNGAPSQPDMEAALAPMKEQLAELQAKLQAQKIELAQWRKQAMDLQEKLNLNEAQAHRWKQLAQDAVENLWDRVGQAAHPPRSD